MTDIAAAILTQRMSWSIVFYVFKYDGKYIYSTSEDYYGLKPLYKIRVMSKV